MGLCGRATELDEDDNHSNKDNHEERFPNLQDIVGGKNVAYYLLRSWDTYRKRINHLVNNVTASNINLVVGALLDDNMHDGATLFTSLCLEAQMVTTLEMTPVFAALVAKLNSTVPNIGQLVLERLLMHWKGALNKNDIRVLLKTTKFLAHLLNQQVAKENLALEIATRLLVEPTEDKVECAIGFIEDVGYLLQSLLPHGLTCVLESLQEILHEVELSFRVQIMIVNLFGIHKARFQAFPPNILEVDLLAMGKFRIHEVSLEDGLENGAHIFGGYPNFTEHGKTKYESALHENSGIDLDVGVYDNDGEGKYGMDTSLLRIRHAIYATLSKCASIENLGIRLDPRHYNALNIKVPFGQELEFWVMLIECCCHEKIYTPHYAYIAESLCLRNRNLYQGIYERCFRMQVTLIDGIDNNKLHNVAKFFGYLVGKGVISWDSTLSPVHLLKEATNPLSCIFINILFQEAIEHMRLDEPKVKTQLEHSCDIFIDRSMPCIINFQHQHAMACQQVLRPQPELVGEHMEYEVEGILKSKNTRKHGRQYLVKWKGYEIDEATWEPIAALKNAMEVVQEFETMKRSMK